MSTSPESYLGYVDGASCSTKNSSSTTWAIFSPNGELLSMQDIFIGRSTNNIAKYRTVVDLLSDVISHGIRCIVIRLNSQLVVLQLANIYSVINPAIFRMVLRVPLLERHFDFIQYEHISRVINTLANAIVNFVLDKHLQPM